MAHFQTVATACPAKAFYHWDQHVFGRHLQIPSAFRAVCARQRSSGPAPSLTTGLSQDQRRRKHSTAAHFEGDTCEPRSPSASQPKYWIVQSGATHNAFLALPATMPPIG